MRRHGNVALHQAVKAKETAQMSRGRITAKLYFRPADDRLSESADYRRGERRGGAAGEGSARSRI
ncbi:hypothetical protein CR492_07020 [Methylocella silvestris]|uniref:Uncharacterized protein n=1 Tax=Methylocella silvestris TaxID=199596 RepID=A0A2J7TIY6_METSI|nr:hypothetical protein CR492_07020 [Methylocella silvestris]